jgi:hypothetical protein
MIGMSAAAFRSAGSRFDRVVRGRCPAPARCRLPRSWDHLACQWVDHHRPFGGNVFLFKRESMHGGLYVRVTGELMRSQGVEHPGLLYSSAVRLCDRSRRTNFLQTDYSSPKSRRRLVIPCCLDTRSTRARGGWLLW